MSFPTEFDFVLVKIGDGATPTENFTLICGVENVTVTEDVNTADRFRRDCAAPGSVPRRRSRVTGSQWQIAGSGVANLDQVDLLSAALGVAKNYEIEFGQRDGTNAGTIIATASGSAILTNRTTSNNADEGALEITLTGQDVLTWDSPS